MGSKSNSSEISFIRKKKKIQNLREEDDIKQRP